MQVHTQIPVLLRIALPLLLGVSSGMAMAGNGVRVELDAAFAQPQSGRLLLFAIPAADATRTQDGTVEQVDTSSFRPTLVSVAAMDVAGLPPGGSVAVDTDALAFPAGFSSLPDGDYFVQAVLDIDRNYNYQGRSAGGDLLSKVVAVRWPASTPPVLTLVDTVPARQAWRFPPRAIAEGLNNYLDAARNHARPLDFASPALTRFHGRPVHLRGWVLLPPGYDTAEGTWPVVYYTHGFGGDTTRLSTAAAGQYALMAEGAIPPMIWVLLDQSSPTGTHEFANSANNGPWGQALTEELIPWLEREYRMDARPSGRLLTGHSSGGWAALWLQVRYPKLFGGAWATAPDSVDFHDFSGVDLYAPGANVYRKPDGSPYPLVRSKGEVMSSFQQFVQRERALGEVGGQMASFDWVFSPRGADGRPLPMFDRDTGEVDPNVVAHWREHYDIVHRLRTRWPQLKDDLDGKIRVVMGDVDNFYLDGATRRLKVALDELGADSEVRLVPGRDHFDLYHEGDDRHALTKQIAREMHAVARPGEATTPAGVQGRP